MMTYKLCSMHSAQDEVPVYVSTWGIHLQPVDSKHQSCKIPRLIRSKLDHPLDFVQHGCVVCCAQRKRGRCGANASGAAALDETRLPQIPK
jgi:hypothetical protein